MGLVEHDNTFRFHLARSEPPIQLREGVTLCEQLLHLLILSDVHQMEQRVRLTIVRKLYYLPAGLYTDEYGDTLTISVPARTAEHGLYTIINALGTGSVSGEDANNLAYYVFWRLFVCEASVREMIIKHFPLWIKYAKDAFCLGEPMGITHV